MSARYLSTDGSDSNDGLAVGAPWATTGKLFAALAADSSGDIDEVVIDTSAGPLRMDAPLYLDDSRPSGFTIRSAVAGIAADLLAFQLLDAGDFAKTAGRTNIYQATVDASAVVWEDRKWLTHANTDDHTDLAGCLTYIDANPGSFHVSGTTLYIHPFGSTNPTSDGKLYEFSPDWTSYIPIDGSEQDTNAIRIDGATNVLVRDLKIGGTARAAASDGSAVNDESVLKGKPQGTSTFQRVEVYYGGKHAISNICDDASSDLTLEDITAYQCTPYAASTVLVSYAASGIDGASHRYIRCRVPSCNGVVGSTEGADASKTEWALENHGSGKFALIEHVGGYYAGYAKYTSGNSEQVRFNDSEFWGWKNFQVATDDLEVLRSHSHQGWAGAANSGSTTNYKHCLIVWDDSTFMGRFEHDFDLQFNTVICGRATPTGGFPRAHIHRYSSEGNPIALTVKNNIFAYLNGSTASNADGAITEINAGDTIAWDNNQYVLVGTGGTVVKSYDEGSAKNFSDWQGLGYDANSENHASYSDLKLNAAYFPAGDSPALGVASGEADTVDRTRTPFAVRDTCGCYQWTDRPTRRLIGAPN